MLFRSPGERLPEAPVVNGNAMARYEMRCNASACAFAQIDVAHKGSMWTDLRTDHRTQQPAYTVGNLRFGLSHPGGRWQAEAYVTNLWDQRALLFANLTGYANYPGHSNPEIANAPRTFGVRLHYSWGKTR